MDPQLIECILLFFLLIPIKFAINDKSHHSNKLQNHLQVNIGFLVNSNSYTGKYLKYVFQNKINKLNKFHQATLGGSNDISLKFLGRIRETSGRESESIKQTVDLITDGKVNFIVGPQDTCRVESHLASIYNVPMISHYCPWSQPQDELGQLDPVKSSGRRANTFVRMKPPHSVTVERVVTLLERLLTTNNGWYPQQLVLLYFDRPTQTASNWRQTKSWAQNKTTPLESPGRESVANFDRGNLSTSPDEESFGFLSTESKEYKEIGKLLKIKLNDLLVKLNSIDKDQRINETDRILRSLSVLNWHTTFHYKISKNPFRGIIRRHLLSARNQQALVCDGNVNNPLMNNRVRPQQITTRATTSGARPSPWSVRAAAEPSIYLIVGHYYEHLGLLLALEELNLLASSADDSPQQPQSSVFSGSNCAGRLQKSIVVGVDIEPYDEQDDSVRFIRGVFANHASRFESGSNPQDRGEIDSIASIYRSYLGVVPTMATGREEFLKEMTEGRGQLSSEAASKEELGNQSASLVLERIFSWPLISLRRLPIELFYLQESLNLLDQYFRHCLIEQQKTLEYCSDGRQAFSWFSDRNYTSLIVNHTVKLDSNAQAEGLFSIISLKRSRSEISQEQETSEFALEPIGSINNQLIELNVDLGQMDSVWLALGCELSNRRNISVCKERLPNCHEPSEKPGDVRDQLHAFVLLASLCSLLLLLFLLGLKRGCLIGSAERRGKLKKLEIGCNAGWFDQNDVKNFLQIVHNFLSASNAIEVNLIPSNENQSFLLPEEFKGVERIMEERIHCYMFCFPSCKFVHWIAALHQLKESMFQYQSGEEERRDGPAMGSIIKELLWKIFKKNPTVKGSFFTVRHKRTASLRILLHKYKSTNDCFVRLASLSHRNVIKLTALKLDHEQSSSLVQVNKIAKLVFEKPCRGNLRDVFRGLIDNVSGASNSEEFILRLVLSFINDLLSGLAYLHCSSAVTYHGDLRSTTCMVGENLQLKLTGFHAHHMRRSLGTYELKSSNMDAIFNDLVYSAPELLDNYTKINTLSDATMKLADIYSFSFILYELLNAGQEPWSCFGGGVPKSSKLLVERVKVDSSFRPPLSRLDKKSTFDSQISSSSNGNEVASPITSLPLASTEGIDLESVQQVLRSCWSQSPTRRPQSVDMVRCKLDAAIRVKLCSHSEKEFISEMYTNILERVRIELKKNLRSERQRNHTLTFKLIPPRVINRLQITKDHSLFFVDTYNCVNFCFFRIIFHPSKVEEEEKSYKTVEKLNEILTNLEALIDVYGSHLQEVASEADSSLRQMVYSGGPLDSSDTKKLASPLSSSQLLASFALQLIDLSNRMQANYAGCIQVKCGLHCGPAQSFLSVASRHSVPRFVLFGKSMQLANVLELNSQAQRIQVSSEYRAELLRSYNLNQGCSMGNEQQSYVMMKREASSKSDLEAYWLLNGPRLSTSQSVTLERFS